MQKLETITFWYSFNRFPESKNTRAGSPRLENNQGKPNYQLNTIQDITDNKALILKHLDNNNIQPLSTFVTSDKLEGAKGTTYLHSVPHANISLTFKSNDEAQLAYAILEDPE